MTELRGSVNGLNSHSRPSRFFMDGGKWYFHTREGGTEGPFDFLHEAETRLESYVQLFCCGLHTRSGPLELQPLEMRWR